MLCNRIRNEVSRGGAGISLAANCHYHGTLVSLIALNDICTCGNSLRHFKVQYENLVT